MPVVEISGHVDFGFAPEGAMPMSLAGLIGGDFELVVDGLVPVTLKRPGSSQNTSVPKALRRALSTREAQNSNGKYTTADTVWHFAVDAGTPHVGDRIVPAGVTSESYTILEAHKETLSLRWRCVTRDLAIAYGLDQLVTIVRYRTIRTTGGAAMYSQYDEIRTGFRARIQISSTTEETENSRQTSRIEARLFMSEPVVLDTDNAVIGPDGKLWDVTTYLAPEEIGQLPEAVLVRRL